MPRMSNESLTKRLSKESHPSLVLNPSFHRALLVCCCSVVLKAIGATHKLRPSPNFQTIQIYNILHILDSLELPTVLFRDPTLSVGIVATESCIIKNNRAVFPTCSDFFLL